jgi:hypothetical protein
MFTKLTLAAGVVAMAAVFAPIGATAAPAMPQTRIVDADGGALVQKAQYGRCHAYWHREVRGPLGLAHPSLLPLPGAARLLTGPQN